MDSDKQLYEVVTDRDLIIRGYANKKSETTNVKEVMRDDLYSIASGTTTKEATDING